MINGTEIDEIKPAFKEGRYTVCTGQIVFVREKSVFGNILCKSVLSEQDSMLGLLDAKNNSSCKTDIQVEELVSTNILWIRIGLDSENRSD